MYCYSRVGISVLDYPIIESSLMAVCQAHDLVTCYKFRKAIWLSTTRGGSSGVTTKKNGMEGLCNLKASYQGCLYLKASNHSRQVKYHASRT